MATAYIGLGSNLGDRMATLRTAVQRLETLGSDHRRLESLRDGAGRIPGATSLPERGRRAGDRAGSRRPPARAARHRARPGSHALLPKRSAHARSRSAAGRRRDPRHARTDPAAPAPARARLRPRPARGDCPGAGASWVWKDYAGAPARAAGPGWCRGLCSRWLGIQAATDRARCGVTPPGGAGTCPGRSENRGSGQHARGRPRRRGGACRRPGCRSSLPGTPSESASGSR